MKTYKRILAMVLTLIMIFAAAVISVSAEEENSVQRLDFSKNDIWNCDTVKFDTDYIAPVPDDSSYSQAYIADLTTYDDVNYYYKLTAKNINMPTDTGLAYIQLVEFYGGKEICCLGVGKGEEQSQIFRLSPYTEYYFRFYNEDKSVADGGELSFNLTRIPDPEPDGYTQLWIEKGEYHNGSITVPEDKDWIAFSLEEGGDYRIVLEKRNETNATFLADLYTFEGEYITSATLDEGRNVSIYFTQETDDFLHYVIRLSCPEGESGDYRVGFNNAKICYTMPLNGGGWNTLDGRGGIFDTLYAKFTTLEQDAHYRFWVKNSDIETNPASADEQVIADLLDENFEFIERITAVNPEERSIVYRALKPNTTYYLKFYNGNPFDAKGGDVYVNVNYDLDADKGMMEHALNLKLGEIGSGELINNFDTDWFKVTTSDDTKYIVMMENKNEYETNSSGVPKVIRAEVYTENEEFIHSIFTHGKEMDIDKLDLESNTTYYIKIYDTAGTTGKYDIMIAERLVLGDTNLDDSVKIQDATLIQKTVAKLATIEGDGLITSDVNADGKINVKDATAIQKYIAKMETPYNIGGYIY